MKGFTLVEVLVVMAIIALIAMISVPAIINLRRSSRDAGRLKQLESIRAVSAGIFTKTNNTVEINEDDPDEYNVKVTSIGVTGETVTDEVFLGKYTLDILPLGTCSNSSTNRSEGMNIRVTHDPGTRTVTYCNEQGIEAEKLVY